MPLLVLIRQPEVPEGVELGLTLDAPRVVIGRGKGCEVQLPDPSVSARHASIRQRGTEHVIIDEGSTNGIVAAGAKLPPHTPQTLAEGELVRVGRVWLECRQSMGVPSPPEQAESVALDFLAFRAAARGEQVQPCIEVIEGPDAGLRLTLTDPDEEYVVGRSAEAALVLSDPSVARRHASVVRAGAGHLVRDLGSTEGSRLGDDVLAVDGAPWRDGDVLTVGATKLRLDHPLPAMLEELRRTPDERMRPAEYSELPPGGLPANAETDETDEEPAMTGQESDADVAAPEPDQPSGTDGAAAGHGRGFRFVEILVVVLALCLLGASILGLVWLFR